MAEIKDDAQVPEIGVEAVPQDETVVEEPVVEEERKFSQAEVDEIAGKVRQEVRNDFDAQFQEYQRQTLERQAAIEEGVRQLTQGQRQTQEDPRTKQLREILAPVLQGIEQSIDQKLAALAPVVAQSALGSFWADKPKVPAEVKDAAERLFKQHFRPGLDANEIANAAFSIAARDYAVRQFSGTAAPQPTAQATKTNQPAPRIPTNPASVGDLGGTRAPVSLGGNKQLGWQETLDMFAQNDVWPGQEEEFFSKRSGRR